MKLETLIVDVALDQGINKELNDLKYESYVTAQEIDRNLSSISPRLGKIHFDVDSKGLDILDQKLTNLNRHISVKQAHIKEFGRDFNAVMDEAQRRVENLAMALDKIGLSGGALSVEVNQTVEVDGSQAAQQIDAAFNRGAQRIEEALSKQVNVNVSGQRPGVVSQAAATSLFSPILTGVGQGLRNELENAVGRFGGTKLIGEKLPAVMKASLRALYDDIAEDVPALQRGADIGKKILEPYLKEFEKITNELTDSFVTEQEREIQRLAQAARRRKQLEKDRKDATPEADRELQQKARENLTSIADFEDAQAAIAKSQNQIDRLEVVANRFRLAIFDALDPQVALKFSRELEEVERTIAGLTQRSFELQSLVPDLEKQKETSKTSLEKARANARGFDPEKAPKALSEIVSQLGETVADEGILPIVQVADEYLKKIKANAAFSAEGNVLLVTKELAKKLDQIETLAFEEVRTLVHELQHAIDAGFGERGKLQDFLNDDVTQSVTSSKAGREEGVRKLVEKNYGEGSQNREFNAILSSLENASRIFEGFQTPLKNKELIEFVGDTREFLTEFYTASADITDIANRASDSLGEFDSELKNYFARVKHSVKQQNEGIEDLIKIATSGNLSFQNAEKVKSGLLGRIERLEQADKALNTLLNRAADSLPLDIWGDRRGEFVYGPKDAPGVPQVPIPDVKLDRDPWDDPTIKERVVDGFEFVYKTGKMAYEKTKDFLEKNITTEITPYNPNQIGAGGGTLSTFQDNLVNAGQSIVAFEKTVLDFVSFGHGQDLKDFALNYGIEQIKAGGELALKMVSGGMGLLQGGEQALFSPFPILNQGKRDIINYGFPIAAAATANSMIPGFGAVGHLGHAGAIGAAGLAGLKGFGIQQLLGQAGGLAAQFAAGKTITSLPQGAFNVLAPEPVKKALASPEMKKVEAMVEDKVLAMFETTVEAYQPPLSPSVREPLNLGQKTVANLPPAKRYGTTPNTEGLDFNVFEGSPQDAKEKAQGYRKIIQGLDTDFQDLYQTLNTEPSLNVLIKTTQKAYDAAKQVEKSKDAVKALAASVESQGGSFSDQQSVLGVSGVFKKDAQQSLDFLAEVAQEYKAHGEDIGTFVNIGLEQGLSIKDAEKQAAQMVLLIKKIVEDGFGIASPSRWAIAIGNYIVQGLEKGLGADNRLTKSAKDINKKIKEAIEGNGLDESVKEQFAALDEAYAAASRNIQDRENEIADTFKRSQEKLERDLKDFDTTYKTKPSGNDTISAQETQGLLSKITKDVKSLAIVGGTAIFGLIFGDDLFRAVNNLAEVNDQQEAMKLSLDAIIDTDVDKFYADMATQVDNLGVSLENTQQTARALEASLVNTSLEGESLELLKGFQATFARFGSSTDQQSRTLLGLQQSAQLGRVALEELKQMAESTPGVMQAAADSYSVTTKELFRMVSAGEILAEDLLPRLSKSLEQRSGVAGFVDTPRASMARFNNEVLKFQDNIGDVPSAIRKAGFDAATSGLKLLNGNMDILQDLATSTAIVLATKFAISLVTATGAAISAAGGVKALMLSLTALSPALSAALPLLAAVGVAYAGLATYKHINRVYESVKPIRELNEELKDLQANYKGLGTTPEQSEAQERNLKRKRGRSALTDEQRKQLDFSRELTQQNSTFAEVAQGIEETFSDMTRDYKILIADSEKLNRLKSIDREISKNIADQRIASSKGDTEAAAKIQTRIIELRKEQRELTRGGFDELVGGLSGIEGVADKALKSLESLKESNPNLYAELKDNVPLFEGFRNKAKELREELQAASQIEYGNLQTATFELEKQLNLIDQRSQKNRIESNQRKSGIIGRYGLGQQGQALEQRDLAQENLTVLRQEYAAVGQKLSALSNAVPDAQELEKLTIALKEQKTTLENATQEQLNTAIASLDDGASDTLKAYAQSVQQRPALLEQQSQLDTQIREAQKNAQQQILDSTNAQVDYYRQSAQQARELRRTVREYNRQLTRQLEDAQLAIDRQSSEIEAMQLGNEIRSKMDSITGDFAGQMTGFIETFFDQIGQFTQNKLETEAQAFAFNRGIDDLVLGNVQFTQQLIAQRTAMADAQASYSGVAKTIAGSTQKRDRHRVVYGSRYDASGEPGSDFTVFDSNDRVIGVPIALPVSSEVLRVDQARGGYGKAVELRIEFEGQKMDLLLAHFDKLASNLTPGAVLAPGALIGTQGRSGNTRPGGWYGNWDPNGDGGTHVSADFYQPGTHTGISDSKRLRFIDDVWIPYLEGQTGAQASSFTPTPQASPQAASGGQPQVRMTDTGLVTDSGLKKFRVDVINGNGQIIHTSIANSGKAGAQELQTSNQGRAGSNNPIPEGVYGIGQLENVPGGLSYSGQNIGPDWIGLQERGGERSAFGFHLDVDGIPGSAGCVVFTDPQAVRRVSEAIAQAGATELVVDYGLGTVAGAPIQRATSAALPNISTAQSSGLVSSNVAAIEQQAALLAMQQKLKDDRTNIDIARSFREQFKTADQIKFQQQQQVKQGERDTLQRALSNSIQTPITQAIGERQLALLDQGISFSEIEFNIKKLTDDITAFETAITTAEDKLPTVLGNAALSDKNKQDFKNYIELLKELKVQTELTKKAEEDRFKEIQKYTGQEVFDRQMEDLVRTNVQEAEQLAETLYGLNPQAGKQVNAAQIITSIEAQFKEGRLQLERYDESLDRNIKKFQALADAGLGEHYRDMAAKLVDASNKVEEAEGNLSESAESLAKSIALMDAAASVRAENLAPVQELRRLERDVLSKQAEQYDSFGDPFPGNFIKRQIQRDQLKDDYTQKIGQHELQILKLIEILKSQGKDAPDYKPLTEIAGGDGLYDATLEVNDFNEAVLEGVTNLQLMQSAMDGLDPEEMIAVHQRSIKALRQSKEAQEEMIQKTLPTFGDRIKETIGQGAGDAFITFTDGILQGKKALQILSDSVLGFGKTILQTIQRIVAQKITSAVLKSIGFPSVGNSYFGTRSVKAQSLPSDPVSLGMSAMKALEKERQMNGGQGVALYAVTEGERILNQRETSFVNALEANGMHSAVGNAYEGSNPGDYPYMVNEGAASKGVNLTMPFTFQNNGGGSEVSPEMLAAIMPLFQQQAGVMFAELLNRERRNKGIKE